MRSRPIEELNAVSGGDEQVSVTGVRTNGPSFVMETLACTTSAWGMAAAITWVVTKNYGLGLKVARIAAAASSAACVATVAQVKNLLQYNPPNSNERYGDYMESVVGTPQHRRAGS